MESAIKTTDEKIILFKKLCGKLKKEYQIRTETLNDSFSSVLERYGDISLAPAIYDKFIKIDAILLNDNSESFKERLNNEVAELTLTCLMFLVEMQIKATDDGIEQEEIKSFVQSDDDEIVVQTSDQTGYTNGVRRITNPGGGGMNG